MILFGSVGMGGALHVSRTMEVILSVRVFSELQACCHCSFVRWLFSNRCISSSIWLELVSKNLVWKFSSFSFGMGLSILGGGSEFDWVFWQLVYLGGFVVVWVNGQS